MTIQQVEFFLEETLKYNKKWKRIRITGGEPSLHPDVLEVADLLLQYKKKHNPDVDLGFTTNGIGIAKNVIANIPSKFKITNTDKSIGEKYKFVAVLDADIDNKRIEKDQVGCDRILLHKNCSRFLSAYGFYACPVALAFDRVLGKDIGIKSLKDCTREAFIRQLQYFCGSCGYKKMDKSREQMISKSWKKQILEYNQQVPELKRYGE